MRLRSFTVQGFANFVQPVSMGPLDEANVLYGPNNAGKSNLLRALELYFRLLGAGEAVTKTQQQMLDDSDPGLSELLAVSFNRKQPDPIRFTADWSISDKVLEHYGLFGELSCNAISMVLQLTLNGRALELRVQKWQMGGQDVAALDRGRDASLVGFAQQIRRLLSDATPFQQEQPVLPCARLAQTFEPFPQSVRDALFDARQSRDPAQRRRWAVFAKVAGELSTELGEGAWDTVFDRKSGLSDVIWSYGDTSLCLSDMGSGVQRLAGLLAELSLAKEPYVCFEEPEWRLSPDLQVRFMRQARQIARAGIGPRQLFVTTHSPAMARGGKPFALELVDGSPVIEQRPWTDGAAVGDSQSDSVGDSAGDAAANEQGPDLDQLVGLVESLAELDPEEILEEPEAPPKVAASGAKPWAAPTRR
ncbi:MAG: AAA family ATPase [Actinomycetota bacterium]